MITLPVSLVIGTLVALVLPPILIAAVALERWLYWRREFRIMKKCWIEAMQDAQRPPFIRTIPLPDISETLDEIDRLRAEIAGESNVIEVEFGKRPK